MKIGIKLIVAAAFLLSLMPITNGQTKYYNPITQNEYLKYFPDGINGAMIFNNQEIVYILPTNEPNKLAQDKLNEHFRTFLRDTFNDGDVYRVMRIITDMEALNQDLSNSNIVTFGTINGNLWTRQFLETTSDFPIKIYKDSIVADSTYKIDNYCLSAAWLNPENKKLVTILYVPQVWENEQPSNYRTMIGYGHCSYCIYQKSKMKVSGRYQMLNNEWTFVELGQNILTERDNKIANNLKTEEIERGIYRYPTLKELEVCSIKPTDIKVNPIKCSQLDTDFKELDDMKWLKPIAKEYKIIALGEEHYRTYNYHLFNRILFAANTYDYYPLLVIEMPWSWGPYFNHYLTIKDDANAQIYNDSVLSKISELPILHLIREWNKHHPTKTLKIGCSDIEHDLNLTLNLIINPYLSRIDSIKLLKDIYNNELIPYLEHAKQLIAKSKKVHLNGEYAFQTPEYYESVIENLLSSIPIKFDSQKNDNHSDRYKVMIRNVTDERFLGKDIREGKSFLFGGVEHFRTIYNKLDSSEFLKTSEFFKSSGKNQSSEMDALLKKHTQTEGFYLANYFEFTKGKVYSIGMYTLGNSIDDTLPKIDPRLGFNYELKLINLYKNGNIKLNEPVIGRDQNQIYNYLYKLSYAYPDNAFRIEEINVAQIMNQQLHHNRNSLIRITTLFDDFNTCIFIPYSPIGYGGKTTKKVAIESQIPDIFSVFQLGQENLDAMKYTDALKFYDQVIQMDSTFEMALYQKTRILLLLGNYLEAYQYSKKLSNPMSYLQKAWCADALGIRKEAIEYYTKVIESPVSESAKSAAKDGLNQPYRNAKTFATDPNMTYCQITPDGWKVEVSSNNEVASYCFDGNNNTRWTNKQNQQPGEYIILDMGKTQNINRISLIDDAMGNSVYRLSYPQKYSIYLSNDKVNWMKITSKNGDVNEYAGAFFEPTEARYIKVIQDGSTDQQWWSVYEFNVYTSKNIISPSY